MYCSLSSTEFVSRLGGLNPGLELVVGGVRVVVKYRDLLRDWWTLQWSGLRVRVGNVFPRWGR